MDAGKSRVAFLRRQGGMSLDYAREAAEEAGFLPQGSGTNDLLDAIDGELRAGPRGRQGSLGDADAAAYHNAHDQVRAVEQASGQSLSPDEREHAIGLVGAGHHPEDAVYQAARAGTEGVLDRNVQRQAFGLPGVSPIARQTDHGLDGSPNLTSNFDAAAGERYRAARSATAERHATFTRAPGVGQVLRQGPTADTFRLEDSRVPAALFSSGPGAAERVQAFMRAGASRPGLAHVLENYAASDLRNAAEREDGSLDPARYARWMLAHSEALSAMPEVRARFQSAVAASETLRQARDARAAIDTSYPIKASATDATIAQRAFVPGPKGAETIRGILDATGRRPGTVAALQDFAATSLRGAAMRADGTLDSAAFQRWARAHGSAVSEIPGMAPRLDTLAHAQRELEDNAARHFEEQTAFQRTAASRFLDGSDPSRAVARILNSDRALPQMQELARLTAKDPDARAGLQQAVVEHILRDHVSNVAAGGTGTNLLKADAFQTFTKRTSQALRTIFSENQAKSIRDIALDVERSNRSIADTKLPGGSNSVQDLHGGAKHTSGHGGVSFLQVIIADKGGEILGRLLEHQFGGGILPEMAGEGGALGLALGNARRAAGLKTVDDLVVQAMLHPRLAQSLLMRATPANTKVFLPKLARSITALGVNAGASLGQTQPAPVPSQPRRGFVSEDAPRASAFAPRVPIGL